MDLTSNSIVGGAWASLTSLFKSQFDGIRSVEVPLPTSLRILIIDHNKLANAGQKCLARVVEHSANLHFLSAENCSLFEIEDLGRALKNSQIKFLNLASNQFGSIGLEMLLNGA